MQSRAMGAESCDVQRASAGAKRDRRGRAASTARLRAVCGPAKASSLSRNTLAAYLLSLGAILGPALGPPLGGFLVDNFSWNWCFEINVVPGVFSAVVLFLLLKDPSKAQRTPDRRRRPRPACGGARDDAIRADEGEQNYWFEDPLILTLSIVSASYARLAVIAASDKALLCDFGKITFIIP